MVEDRGALLAQDTFGFVGLRGLRRIRAIARADCRIRDNVASGAVRTLEDSEVVSFFWAPDSQRLVTMAFDSDAGMCWSVLDVESARKHRLGSNFYPSRELVYFSWFFDQFAVSHPPISADGTRLVFAGHMGIEGGAPESA